MNDLSFELNNIITIGSIIALIIIIILLIIIICKIK